MLFLLTISGQNYKQDFTGRFFFPSFLSFYSLLVWSPLTLLLWFSPCKWGCECEVRRSVCGWEFQVGLALFWQAFPTSDFSDFSPTPALSASFPPFLLPQIICPVPVHSGNQRCLLLPKLGKVLLRTIWLEWKLFQGRDSVLFLHLLPIHWAQQLKLSKYLLIITKLDWYKPTKFGDKSFS